MDFNGIRTVTSRYLFRDNIDGPLARERVEEGLASYLPDHLRTVGDVIDVVTGAVVEDPEYAAFGVLLPDSFEGLGDRYRFTESEYDPETGLFYYRARYYDPRNGFFLSHDSIRIDGEDRNFRRYFANIPILLNDPSGNRTLHGYTLGFLAGGAFGQAVAEAALTALFPGYTPTSPGHVAAAVGIKTFINGLVIEFALTALYLNPPLPYALGFGNYATLGIGNYIAGETIVCGVTQDQPTAGLLI